MINFPRLKPTESRIEGSTLYSWLTSGLQTGSACDLQVPSLSAGMTSSGLSFMATQSDALLTGIRAVPPERTNGFTPASSRPYFHLSGDEMNDFLTLFA